MGYRIEKIHDGCTAVYNPKGNHLADFLGSEHREAAEEYVEFLLSQVQPAQPAGPTVRCRIAVAVSRLGDWAAFGQRGDDSYLTRMMERSGYTSPGDRISFVEANVPIPQRVEPAVIEGTVSDAKGGE
jgi:hypothetical protein